MEGDDEKVKKKKKKSKNSEAEVNDTCTQSLKDDGNMLKIILDSEIPLTISPV